MHTRILLASAVTSAIALLVALGSCNPTGQPGADVEAKSDASPAPAQAAVPADEPIFKYVMTPDAAFEWKKTAKTPGGPTRLEMTSQVWQGITWKHRIAIVKPIVSRHPELCVMLITGGEPDTEELVVAATMANTIGMPFAILGDIPNQPLFEDLNEDHLISFTFAKFLETKDATWPCLFPMTKAAVRAMDALQELSEKEWDKKIEGFVITGASKRGWTTWFTGEVDKRVKAIIPMVYDNLNLPAQMKHHIAQWGDYSHQISEYSDRGLPQLLGSEEGKELGAMVDPYTYRDQATMPKLIVTGTNDAYWPLDAARDYFDDLVGPRYILYVPNSGHGLEDIKRVLNGASGFARATTGEIPFPEFEWNFETTDAGVKLSATSETQPKRVLLWKATAPTKDFREVEWSSQPIEAVDGAYSHTLPTPAEGFAAVFMEFTFDAKGQDFPLSTLVRIVGAE